MAVRLVPPRSRTKGAYGRALGRPQSGGVTIRMIGFEGRRRWRQHRSFKLRAKLPQCEKFIFYNWLQNRPASFADTGAHPKFAIRTILVRRTRIVQASNPVFSAAS